METGGWSATIHAFKGSEQEETEAVIAFPIPLKHNEKVALNYRNVAELAAGGSPPCTGTANEPEVEAGNLCVFRGGAGFGSKEASAGEGSVDKFVRDKYNPIEANRAAAPEGLYFEDFHGEQIFETGTGGNSGDLGVDFVFRTFEYNECGVNCAEPAIVTSLLKESNLNAKGSWAVRAK